MRTIPLAALLCCAARLTAQSSCEGTPAYSPCEFVFELQGAEATAHPNPYSSVELRAEFRSPHFHTYLMPAFWDGRKLVIRFVPTEAGEWIYRLLSNLPSADGKQGTFHATDSNSPGYIKVANVHHWATDNKQPHLWMGYIADRIGLGSRPDFEQTLNQAAANKFNHLRVSILGNSGDRERVFLGPDAPNPTYFEELDSRILAIHKKGIITDLVLASDPDYLTSLMPDWQSRERFVRYIVARYGALNVTWQGLADFDEFANGRDLLKELGLAIKNIDPYQHPRSTNAKVTSSPLLGDGWMDFILEDSMDDAVASVEHQLYQVPFVGVTDARHLWNTTMDGEYPEFQGGEQDRAKDWFDFILDTRHWELEPYFYLDGGRAMALEEIEYLAYIEKPGQPVEIELDKHGYDVIWLNPVNGQMLQAKKYNGEHFTGDPPDRSHPWVLLVAREGRKESMLKSYKFESAYVPVQEIELSPQKVPFEIAAPPGDTLSVSKPAWYSMKIVKATRATRSMTYLITGEVPADGMSFRVLGTSAEGTLRIPPALVKKFPAVVNIRVVALNANGKAYAADKVYQLTQ